MFLDIIHFLVFYLKQPFGDLILSMSSTGLAQSTERNNKYINIPSSNILDELIVYLNKMAA
jgi:hypothetical protein